LFGYAPIVFSSLKAHFSFDFNLLFIKTVSMKVRIASFFSLFKQAVLGSEQNFTEGSINRAIFLLSVPMILEMAMESLFAVVDIFFVSRLNDSNAVAVIGLTESMLTLVYSLAMGLSMGATALVARRVGEKDYKNATIAGAQVIIIGIAFSIVISLVGVFFYEDLLRLMGASNQVIATGSRYALLMFGGNITIMMLFLINGVFRGAGNAAIAMRALWIANLFNMILDPIFIFGWGPIPAYGVEGAAIATNTGRAVGVLIQVFYLFKGSGIIKIRLENFKPDFGVIVRLLKLSAGGTGQFIIASASWVFLMKIVSNFGDSAVAGYTIAVRVIVFTILPSWGMANAAATLVGQNLGAGQPDRAEKSVWKTGFANMIFLGLIMIVFLFLSEPILSFFTRDSVAIMNGAKCLQVVACGYLFYGYGMVVAQSFNGAGDTTTPTILNLCGFWLFQIPLAYTLAILLGFGSTGAYAAIAIAESAMAVVSILIFRKGKWKTIKV
jgi:putative MATE family efflux protein